MRNLHLLFVMATACTVAMPGDGDTPAPTDPSGVGSPTTPVVCDAEIDQVEPLNGALSVEVDAEVVVTFTEPVTSGTWAVAVAGAEGVASLAEDGLSATWISDVDLEPETEYTVEAEVCGEPFSSIFVTVGAPIEPVEVDKRSYAVEFASMTFTEPPRGGSILANFVAFEELLVQFVSVNDEEETAEMAVTVGRADPVLMTREPLCEGLVTGTGDFSDNPKFEFGPQTVTVPYSIVGGQIAASLDFEELVLTFEVSEDGTELLNPTFSALMATDEVLESPCESAWQVVLTEGSCLPCSSSPTGTCLLVEANATSAGEIAGYDLQQECAP